MVELVSQFGDVLAPRVEARVHVQLAAGVLAQHAQGGEVHVL